MSGAPGPRSADLYGASDLSCAADLRGLHDVVVVGGGPAGSTVATLVARAGARVTVCESARFPRHKICGEFLPPAALAYFDRLGVRGAVESLAPRRHAGMAVIAPGGGRVLGRYGGRAPWGLALRRIDLDAALLRQARCDGAQVLEAARVVDVARATDGIWSIRLAAGRTLRARAIVGADGRNSIVARRLGLRRRDRHRRFAVMGHFEGVRTPDDHGEMIVTSSGYCGINPLPGGVTNVCFVLDPRRPGGRPAGRGGLAAFFRERVAEHPLIRARMEEARLREGLWASGPLACRSSGVVADGALLVGDAAGFFDPFTGEGIGMALRGGVMAAETLLEALRRGEPTRAALRPYAARRRAAFSTRLRFDRLLQAILLRPRLADWVVERLRRDPRLADLLARVAGETVEPGEVFSPRFAARLLLA